MKLYGGIDLHSNNNVIVIIDEKGEVKARKRLENDLNLVLRFLAPFTTELTGLVVESTFNWYWLVDGLMDAAFKIHLAKTNQIIAIKTVAHKLARACFYVLRDQVPFDVAKAFG
jgi:transposase